jgi:hypothetical protein
MQGNRAWTFTTLYTGTLSWHGARGAAHAAAPALESTDERIDLEQVPTEEKVSATRDANVL